MVNNQNKQEMHSMSQLIYQIIEIKKKKVPGKRGEVNFGYGGMEFNELSS